MIAKGMGQFGRPIARHFARAIGAEPIRTMDEADFAPSDAAGNDWLFIGLPDDPQAASLLPRKLALTPTAFEIAGQRLTTRWMCCSSWPGIPTVPETLSPCLHPLSPDAADLAAVKICHYGRYSYLAFSDGRNRTKGTWEVNVSPTMVRWDTSSTPSARR